MVKSQSSTQYSTFNNSKLQFFIRTKQTGYPYLNVINLFIIEIVEIRFFIFEHFSKKVSSYLNENKETVLKISQSRFFSNGSQPTEAEDYIWKVPISIVTQSSYPNVHKEILLEKRSDEVNLGIIPENNWIKLNKNTVGLYRTNYAPELLERIVTLIKEQNLHPTDRLGLQSDVFALVSFNWNYIYIK